MVPFASKSALQIKGGLEVFGECPLSGVICLKIFVRNFTFVFVRGDDSSAYDFASYCTMLMPAV